MQSKQPSVFNSKSLFAKKILSRLSKRTAVIIGLALLVLISLFAFIKLVSAAETGTITISNITPGGEPQESGVIHKYRVQFTCQDISGAGCGSSSQIIIPLNQPAVTTPSMINDTGVPAKDWVYSAELTVGGVNAVLSAGIVGNNYVIELNPAVITNGVSNGLLFNVTPPNFYTEDGTTWDLTPSYYQNYDTELPADSCTRNTGPGEPTTCVSTSPTITSEATADVVLNQVKTGPDGCTDNCESVAGSNFTTTLTTSCSSANGSAFGRLLLEEATVVDRLPAGTTYVSSTPAGGVYDAVAHTVTWESPPNPFPAGCNSPQVAADAYKVTVQIPPGAQEGDTFTNISSFDSPGKQGITDEVTTTARETELRLEKEGPGGCTDNCEVVPDSNFTTTLKVSCLTTFGQPELGVVTVTDVLPPGLQYVSSTPTGGVYNPGTHTVTWESPPLAVPFGCGTPSQNLNAYTVTTYVPANAPNGSTHTNTATVSSPGLDSVTDTATAVVRDPSQPPTGGTAGTKGKLVFTPLPGDDTYAGRWLDGDFPASDPEVHWRFWKVYSATNAFMTESFEPLPCLVPAGPTLTSPAPSPADGTTVPNCTQPAIHPTEYKFNQFANSGFGTAWLDGWRPQVVMIDGSVMDLNNPRETITAASTGASFFMEDQLPAINIEEVAQFYLAPHPAMKNGHHSDIYGYADVSVPGDTVIQNTYTAVPYFNETQYPAETASNKVDILPTERVMNIWKTNAPATSITGQFSSWIQGFHKGATPPPNGITVTDLLPVGEVLTNIPATGNIRIRLDDNANISSPIVEFDVPFVIINDYQGTGRQAIQYTIPPDDPNTPEYDGIRAGQIYWDAIWQDTAVGAAPGTANRRQPSKYVDQAGTYINDSRIQSIGDTTPNLRCLEGQKLETVPAGYPGAGEVSCVASDDFVRPPDELKLISRKTNTPTSGGDGIYNSYIWNFVRSSRVPNSPLVITDLLAIDQTWTNPPGNGMLWVRFCTATNCPGGTQGWVQVPYTVTPDYLGSGRTQIRYEVPPDDPNTPERDGIRAGDQWFYAPVDQLGTVWAMSVPDRQVYTNNSSIYSEDPDASAECFYPAEADIVPAGAVNAGSTRCVSAASYSRLDTGANYDLYKRGIGNRDNFEQDIGGTATGSSNASGGEGDFRITWLNSGSIEIKEVTMYDIFAHVGDTGVGAAQSTAPRGSEWAPEFNGIVSTTPGTIVSYSLSTNPCRPEAFYPSTQPAGCVDDWTTTPPSPLSSVKAIRIFNPNTFTPTQTVEAVYNLVVPDGAPEYSQAVNSVAGNGVDLGNTPIDATESQRFVFRTAGTPTMTTEAPVLQEQGQPITDQVFVGNTDGESGNINWTLYGPIDAVNDSCQGLDWSGAPVAFTASQFITGDGTYSTTAPGENIVAGGCYSFGDVLSGRYWETVTIEPGVPSEVTTIRSTPAIVTLLNPDGYSDDVTITDTAGFSGSLTWTLFGPVPAGPSGDCSAADWTGAPVYATATVTITGDGTTTTTPPAAPTVSGCYSYQDDLAENEFMHSATSVVGQPDETFAVKATPAMTTLINADGFSDDVTITGTDNFAGTISWTLFGPVAPGPDGTCATADYSTAAVYNDGTLDIVGDGTFTTTPAVRPTTPGCYSYADTLDGPNYSEPVVSEVGKPEESFRAQATPQIATAVAEDAYSDNVAIFGTGGFAGTLTWTLYGPANPGPSGTCDDTDWTDAVVFETGTVAVTGDGVITTTPASNPEDGGCYSYADVLSGPDYTADAVSVVGQPLETYARNVAPEVATVVSADQYSDDVTITGTMGFGGTIAWTLYGPVDAGEDGTCATVDWSTAPVYETGSQDFVGDGTYTTSPAVQPTDGGCYSYADVVSGPNLDEARSEVGQELETFPVAATPTVVTIINDDDYSDDVTIADTNGFVGRLDWSLYGPVLPGPSETCEDADWTDALLHSSGTVAIIGDGTTTTTPIDRPTKDGCYSYEDILSGPNFAEDVISVVGQTDETFLINNPNLITKKVADRSIIKPGDVVTYTITIYNPSDTIYLGATATDDLTDVIDDSTYNNDAIANVGETSYTEPVLSWSGNIEGGDDVVITYTVTANNPLANGGKLDNIVIVPDSNCRESDEVVTGGRSLISRLVDTVTMTDSVSAAAYNDPACRVVLTWTNLSKTGQSTSMYIAVGAGLMITLLIGSGMALKYRKKEKASLNPSA